MNMKEKLSEIYSELSVDDDFDKADDTLSVAAKSIAEIITLHGKVNLDFNDVKTVLKDGGVVTIIKSDCNLITACRTYGESKHCAKCDENNQ